MTDDTFNLVPHSRVRLVFETIHTDRAGETSRWVASPGVVADIAPSGQALIVLDVGIHTQFPAEHLFPVPPIPPEEDPLWIGGQSVTRDFFATGLPVLLRWMTQPELEQYKE